MRTAVNASHAYIHTTYPIESEVYGRDLQHGSNHSQYGFVTKLRCCWTCIQESHGVNILNTCAYYSLDLPELFTGLSASYRHHRDNLPTTELLLNVLWWAVLVRVVLKQSKCQQSSLFFHPSGLLSSSLSRKHITYLVVATIVLVIQLLSVLSRVTLGLLAVNVVRALGLRQSVDFGARETHQELLGELVGDGLA